MTDRAKQDWVRIQGLAAKNEVYCEEVLEMMRLQIKDGLGAMAYGQFGGSTPNPTQNAVIASEESLHVWARDNQAETDLLEYETRRARILADSEFCDYLRRKYMSASNDERNRLDPTDYCVVHWALHLHEGHRRHKGNLCKLCAGFYEENKREPTSTEADYFHRHGRWPHRLVDPRTKKPA